MEIKLVNAKWVVNGKPFTELTPNERIILDKFIADFKSYEEYSQRIN